MKKNLLLCAALFALSFAATGQDQGPTASLKTSSTPTVVTDVLHYYLNKHYFKTGNTDLNTYQSYKTDATGVSTSTAITFCGSKFEVPAGETVTITGLEAYVKKAAGTADPSFPIHLYLFKLDPLTGLPQLPIIDSVICTASSTLTTLLGGNFTKTVTLAARTMTTSFAVGLRNMSLLNGDFAYLLRTAGATETNVVAPPSEKYSDGYGFVRYNGMFYSTKNFNMIPGFGIGTDYEFMVAPRVTYELQASQILPAGLVIAGDLVTVPDTLCTRTVLTITNTSSGFYEHRQYNLNQFYRKWNLYSAFPQSVNGAFAPDSSITWNFEFYEDQPESRVFLHYTNNHTISVATDKALDHDCYTTNQFRARLKPMDALGVGAQLIYNEDFKVCFRYCNGDAVGVKSLKGYEDLKIYPNPVVNSKTILSGLRGKNTVEVFDILGQCISKEITENDGLEINLSKQARGTYFLHVTNALNELKVVKIITEN